METWKLEELQAIAQEIVYTAKERDESWGFFTYDAHNVYINCAYTAYFTPVVYNRDTGYEGGGLCSLKLYNINGCWYDEDENEIDITDEEEQMLQDAVNELIS